MESIRPMYIDKFQAWANHVNGELLEKEQFIECIIDDVVVHFSPEEAYIAGEYSQPVGKKNMDINVRGVENGEPTQNIVRIENPKRVVITLDDNHGRIEFFSTFSLPVSSGGDGLTIDVMFDEDDTVEYNWRQMTLEERKDVLSDIPESHHKELIKTELKSAGLI